jgi:hypothetical protein
MRLASHHSEDGDYQYNRSREAFKLLTIILIVALEVSRGFIGVSLSLLEVVNKEQNFKFILKR